MIKIEKSLYSFIVHLPNFLYVSIRAFKWEGFFRGETKVRLAVVDMFFAAQYHLVHSFATMKGEKVSFFVEEINDLYGLSNKPID